MVLSIKNTRSADFSADRIDVITIFAVITNVVIKRVHCINFSAKNKDMGSILEGRNLLLRKVYANTFKDRNGNMKLKFT